MSNKRWSLFYAYLDAVLRSDLQPAPLRVALVIARHVDAEGLAWPSLKTIQAESGGPSKSTVLAAIKTLERTGWLTVERQGARAEFLGEKDRYRPRLPRSHVRPAGPEKAADHVRPAGPDDQVRNTGPIRSGAAQPSGPAQRIFEPVALPSRKEPIKEPVRGDPTPGVSDGASPNAVGSSDRISLPAEQVEPLTEEWLANEWFNHVGKHPPTGAVARAAWRSILEIAGRDREPRLFIKRAFLGFRWDGYAIKQGHPLALFARDPSSFIRTAYNAPSDFSHVDRSHAADWVADALQVAALDGDCDASAPVRAKEPRKAPTSPDEDEHRRLTLAILAEHERRIVAAGGRHGNIPSFERAYNEASALAGRSLRDHPDDAERWALRVVAGMFSLIGKKPSWDQLRRHTDRDLAQAGEHADAA